MAESRVHTRWCQAPSLKFVPVEAMVASLPPVPMPATRSPALSMPMPKSPVADWVNVETIGDTEGQEPLLPTVVVAAATLKESSTEASPLTVHGSSRLPAVVVCTAESPSGVAPGTVETVPMVVPAWLPAASATVGPSRRQ